MIFSCNNVSNFDKYGLRLNIPTYLEEYNRRDYMNENNITNWRHIAKEELWLKDSMNSTFLHFEPSKNSGSNYKKFTLFANEMKEIIEAEHNLEWIDVYIGKRKGFEYCSFKYYDTVSDNYNASLFWNMKDLSLFINFNTHRDSVNKIQDFNDLVKGIKIVN